MSAPPRAPDPWLLGKLVCPLTRRPLRHDEAACELVSDAASLAYPIRDGVPVMLIEAARRIGTPAGAARVEGEPSEKESQS